MGLWEFVVVESREATFQFNAELLLPLAFVALVLLLGYGLDRLVQSGLNWFTQRHQTRITGAVAHALHGKLFLAIALIIIPFGADLFIDTPVLIRVIQIAVTIALILLVSLFLMQLATQLVNVFVGDSAVASTSILNNVIRAIVLTMALVTVMNTLGISITPLLGVIAGSSVGITLALQQPLSNLFAGMMLLASNKVQPGDYIRLATGQEGYVTDILWHTTYIRELTNNIICVPNAVMVSAILTNFNEPERELSLLIDLAVEFDEDLEHVERVTLEVANAVMREVVGGVPEFECLMRYNAIREYAVGFTVIIRSTEFGNQFLLKHELLKRLMQRYREEQINIAFPVRGLFSYQANWAPEANGKGVTTYPLRQGSVEDRGAE